ncbi:hypothetical protein CSB11_02455 [Candidatus Campbellbacteria bacterium]|nr:MAG: hypothetical protein CSB11_02455 [Candidatus Campbellbacteria bacterium]
MNSEFKIIKPKFLYHGSETPDLKILKPQVPRGENNVNEPCAVYASDDKAISTMIAYRTVRNPDTFLCVNNIRDKKIINYIGKLSKEEYLKTDNPFSLYKLDSEDFYHHDEGDMSEFIADQEQRVLSEEKFDSVLKELVKYGVNFYSVSEDVFEEIKSDMSKNMEVLKREGLKPLYF